MFGRKHVDDKTDRAHTGLRRVDWVRVVVGEDGPRAEAVGVRHRTPTSAPITLLAAAQLVAGGAPLVFRDVRVEA